MRYVVLDTDVASRVIKRQLGDPLAARLTGVTLCVTFVTVGELLEIAIVPMRDGQPFLAGSYTTLINPGRPIPRRPWISPGLTSKVLATAPTLSEVAPELAERVNTFAAWKVTVYAAVRPST